MQAVRRRRRRRSAPRGATGAECGASACGLTPKEAAAAAATEATCARHRRHATVSSASLRSPWGRRAIGRVGARRFDAAGVSNAAPTGTEAQAASHRCRPGCGVRRRPAHAADPPGCLGGVRRWRQRFPLTSSASAAGCRVGVRSHRFRWLYRLLVVYLSFHLCRPASFLFTFDSKHIQSY